MEHLEKLFAHLTSATPAAAIFVIAVLALGVVGYALHVIREVARSKEEKK